MQHGALSPSVSTKCGFSSWQELTPRKQYACFMTSTYDQQWQCCIIVCGPSFTLSWFFGGRKKKSQTHLFVEPIDFWPRLELWLDLGGGLFFLLFSFFFVVFFLIWPSSACSRLCSPWVGSPQLHGVWTRGTSLLLYADWLETILLALRVTNTVLLEVLEAKSKACTKF